MLGLKKLKVWVYNNPVGEFEQVNDESYKFSYFNGVHPREEVSLLMPVDKGPFLFKSFPAVFGSHIPQSAYKTVLTGAWLKVVGVNDVTDMDILYITGRNQCGRLSFTDTDCIELTKPEQVIIDKEQIENCSNSALLFHRLMCKAPVATGARFGVSDETGKILGRTNFHDDSLTAESPRTTKYDETILKYAQMFPAKFANQKICLNIAKLAGFTIPKHILSKDKESLLLQRFDRQGGEVLGFEDFSSLVPAKGVALKVAKSAGTYAEAIKGGIQAYQNRGCSEDDIRKFEIDIFERIVLSNLIRDNGLHLKNIGLLYSKDKVALSPVYGITCTDVITIDGGGLGSFMGIPWEKENDDDNKWKTPDQLITFGVKYTSLDKETITRSVNRIVSSIQKWCEITIENSTNIDEVTILCAIAPGVDVEVPKEFVRKLVLTE